LKTSDVRGGKYLLRGLGGYNLNLDDVPAGTAPVRSVVIDGGHVVGFYDKSVASSTARSVSTV
jgi:hypothetical protein